MSKKEKKVIVIGEEQYPLEKMQVCMSVEHFITLMENQRSTMSKNCISQLRPFIVGDVGRRRLERIELELEEQGDFVLEEVEETSPEIVVVALDEDGRQRKVRGVEDFSGLVQIIQRNK